MNIGVIYDWRLEGSIDNTAWTTLYEVFNFVTTSEQITLDPAVTTNKFSHFRIYVVKAGSPYPGFTMFQIYTVDDLM